MQKRERKSGKKNPNYEKKKKKVDEAKKYIGVLREVKTVCLYQEK